MTDGYRERGLRDAVLAGDAAAWRELYEGACAAVERYVSWRCAGLHDLAEDAAQEAWLLAVRRLAGFDPARCDFAGWVCGIASNCVRNRLRGVRRYRKHLRTAALSLRGPAAESSPEPDDRVPLALAELPERYERVLKQKYLDGLGVAEIAAAGGVSAKAVESLLARARSAFREAYTRLGGAT